MKNFICLNCNHKTFADNNTALLFCGSCQSEMKEYFCMKCQKCGKEFMEREIQVSHDVPKYVGGKDIDGRHNLCIKCHNIYERTCFAVMVKVLPEDTRVVMRNSAKKFASNYFNQRGEGNGDTTEITD